MSFYHYTSLENLQQIIEEKQIKTTASNLLRPIAPHFVENSFVDITDSIKPVVWLTNTLDFENAIENGLTLEKTEAVIVIPSILPIVFQKWDKWAEKNGIEKGWFEEMKKSAANWDSFYVSESSIPITASTEIRFRPDIMEDFKRNMK